MPDPHGIVGEIEIFLNSKEGLDKGRLQDLAGPYATMCEEANNRLRRCADYLRRGLHAEAIHHAEIQPDLLDLIAGLDFSGSEDWCALCTENNLPVAPALLMDIAEQLNKAYVVERGAKHLLARLRVLSLSRASVGQRLGVLRSLAELDPGNAHLEEDIIAFEKARIEEISADIKEAFQAKNIRKLTRLNTELAWQNWVQTPPPKLLEAVTSMIRQLQVEKAQGKLSAILPELHNAYSAMSHEECKQLLGRWDDIIAGNSLTLSADMQSQVQPIVDWVAGRDYELQQEQDFISTCSALSAALDEHTSVADLHKMHQKARSFDQPLPEELEHKFSAKLVELELAGRRRSRMILMGGVAAVLVIGGAVAFMVHRNIVEGRVNGCKTRLAAAIDKAIGTGDWSSPVKTWEWIKREHPDLVADSRLQILKERLDKGVTEESTRASKFREVMEKLKKAGPGNPDSGLMDLAKELAKASEEILELTNFTTEVSRERRLAQKKIDDAFLKEVLAVTEKLNAADTTPITGNFSNDTKEQLETRLRDINKCKAGLQEIERQIDGLLARTSVSPGAKDGLTPLKRKLESLYAAADGTKVAVVKWIGELDKQDAERIAVLRLANYVRSSDVLKTALEDFGKKFPLSQKKEQFTKAASQAAKWASVEHWMLMTAPWGNSAIPAKASGIPMRIEEIGKYLKKYPLSPIKKSSGEYIAYLKKAAAVLGDDSPWLGDNGLRNNLESPIMLLHSFKCPEGKRYYKTKNGRISEDSIGLQIEIVKAKDMSAARIIFKGATRKNLKAAPGPSPQLKLGEEISDRLEELTTATWNTLGLDIAKRIKDCKEVDPILRAILLTKVLGIVQDTGWGLNDELPSILNRLERLRVNEINWMDPTNRNARADIKVKAALAGITPFASLKKTIQDKRQAMFKHLKMSFVGRGMALKDEQGWTVLTPRMNTVLQDGSTIWAVSDSKLSNDWVLTKVGDIRNGKVVINSLLITGLPEGTMVFIRKGQ